MITEKADLSESVLELLNAHEEAGFITNGAYACFSSIDELFGTDEEVVRNLRLLTLGGEYKLLLQRDFCFYDLDSPRCSLDTEAKFRMRPVLLDTRSFYHLEFALSSGVINGFCEMVDAQRLDFHKEKIVEAFGLGEIVVVNPTFDSHKTYPTQRLVGYSSLVCNINYEEESDTLPMMVN